MCGIKYIQYSPQVGIYSDKHDERYWTEPDIGIYNLRLNNMVSGFISNIRLNFLPPPHPCPAHVHANIHVHFHVHFHVNVLVIVHVCVCVCVLSVSVNMNTNINPKLGCYINLRCSVARRRI
jgi:hypothetical protein